MSDSLTRSNQTHAIIVAGGRGERSGLDQPKQFQTIAGKPMIRHSVEVFLADNAIDKLWIVIGDGQTDALDTALSGLSNYQIVLGGPSRQESANNGLAAIANAGGSAKVLIHDAARPFLSHDMIARLLDALNNHDAAIPVLPTTDTVVTINSMVMQDIVDRDSLWRVQTPQAFAFPKLWQAHQSWSDSADATDDAQIMKAAGHQVVTVEGDEKLAKFTTAQDFSETDRKRKMLRTGMGYDVHRLVTGEELWLGGIEIEHDKGLSGHSDADVLLHALTDALLGSIGAGDIGDHFPPSDPKWRGARSRQFVEHAALLIKQKGGLIHNIDMTVICEAPKIKPHRETIRSNIADMLGLSKDQVSVKATTTEGLGFTGRKEGIAAQGIATISMEEL